MKADATTQLYLDRGDEQLVRGHRWTSGTQDMAMVSIGMLTIYASSPDAIAAGLRSLADQVDAMEFTDERVKSEASDGDQPHIATCIKTMDEWRGDARLYRLSPPLASDYSEDQGATADGEVVSFMELPGSQRGTLDHDVALAAAGYSVTPQAVTA